MPADNRSNLFSAFKNWLQQSRTNQPPAPLPIESPTQTNAGASLPETADNLGQPASSEQNQAQEDAAAAARLALWRQEVMSLWLAYTGLPPRQQDLDLWAELLDRGASPLILQLLLSKDPLYRPYLGAPNEAVNQAFQRLFGRPPTEAELSEWGGKVTDFRFPAQLMASAQGLDRVSLDEKLLVMEHLIGIAEREELDFRDPLTVTQVQGFLLATHAHSGGKTAVAVTREIDAWLSRGASNEFATIQSVALVDRWLSIFFDQTIDWQHLDRNGNGFLELTGNPPELIVGMNAHWKLTGSRTNDQGQPETLTVEVGAAAPLTNAQIISAQGARLFLRLADDSSFVKTPDIRSYIKDINGDLKELAAERVIDGIIILGLRDLGGQFGDVFWPAS